MFWTQNFSEPKIVQKSNFFGTKNSLGPHMFWDIKYSGPKIFRALEFFGPKNSRNQKSFKTQNFSRTKIFPDHEFSGSQNFWGMELSILYPYFKSKHLFYKIFPISTKDSKTSYSNRKWNHPNRKGNYFSNFPTLDQLRLSQNICKFYQGAKNKFRNRIQNFSGPKIFWHPKFF